MSVPSSWRFRMGPLGRYETSVRNYHSALSNTPEERRSCPHRDGSNTYCFFTATTVTRTRLDVTLYRVIEKPLCTWWLKYTKLQVMFKVYPASLQIFIVDSLTPSVIHNSNYVIMVSDRNCLKHLKYFCVFVTVISCSETFWSPCTYIVLLNAKLN
jgi:hypothetical protein